MKKNSQRGASLIGIVISLTVASLVAIAASQLMIDVSKGSINSEKGFNVVDLEQNIIGELISESAWSETQTSDTQMACLRNSLPCPNQFTSFNLYSSNGQSFYDSTNPHTGLDSNFKICSTFDNQSISCLYRYALEWSPVCSTNPCPVNSLIAIRAILTSNSALPLQSNFNPSNYSIPKLYRMPTASSFCGTANGMSAYPAPTSGLCLTGALAGAVTKIGSLWQWTCAGRGMTQICSAPISCAATDAAWMQNCAGSLPLTPFGNSSVADSTTSFSGQATFDCKASGWQLSATPVPTCVAPPPPPPPPPKGMWHYSGNGVSGPFCPFSMLTIMGFTGGSRYPFFGESFSISCNPIGARCYNQMLGAKGGNNYQWVCQ